MNKPALSLVVLRDGRTPAVHSFAGRGRASRAERAFVHTVRDYLARSGLTAEEAGEFASGIGRSLDFATPGFRAVVVPSVVE